MLSTTKFNRVDVNIGTEKFSLIYDSESVSEQDVDAEAEKLIKLIEVDPCKFHYSSEKSNIVILETSEAEKLKNLFLNRALKEQEENKNKKRKK